MSIMNDYLVSALHEQRAHELIAEAEQNRLGREARGSAKPWWQRLFQPQGRRTKQRGNGLAVARHRVAD